MILDVGGESILETTQLQRLGHGIHIPTHHAQYDDERFARTIALPGLAQASHAAEADSARPYNAYLRDDGCEKSTKVLKVNFI